ncbi:CehA/McbA family metallohydrolase [Thalassoglobus sp. JC818]|uniref:CehA/McbA family metallohydrolase n=1 Tax=Thalassoglobus sp. JC818 TaxID=3232136 RepID=UPI00345A92B8
MVIQIRRLLVAVLLLGSLTFQKGFAEIPVLSVDGQPLAANVARLIECREAIGDPFPEALLNELKKAVESRDSLRIQELLDSEVLLAVHLNPEYRVKVTRGPKKAVLTQHGYQPFLVKVINESTLTERLRVSSPQSGNVYSGVSPFILQRQQQEHLGDSDSQETSPTSSNDSASERIFQFELFDDPPLTDRLSGLEVEYVLLLAYCSEEGKREATLAFDVGQGTQDLGFRGEIPILFECQPAVPVRLSIHDEDGTPTTARLMIRDAKGRVLPPQPKRLAPDFFFQEQIYRHDGESIRLAPGEYSIISSRGPEYVVQKQQVTIDPQQENTVEVHLQRWVNPMEFGFYSGDHHIHGAGCSHYQDPTQGVSPVDMFRQVKGEGLNVGCVLTWGPCFDFQRRYFSPQADLVSEPMTLLKYDLEISGFGSAALGHVCLLNLSDQVYPGTNGTTDGWPTWTVPVMRWAKDQGGVTGYPHSDMRIDEEKYADWILRRHDKNGDKEVSIDESEAALLPDKFGLIDEDATGTLSRAEIVRVADRAANTLPNLVLPSMNGSGAMEIFVSASEGVCDFTSAMDTGRIGEWNTWYHLLNCGLPIKLSGETDFPCMSSRRVGQGRVYVNLGEEERQQIQFSDWCEGLAAGRSYVSDGYAHALKFEVSGVEPGTGALLLKGPSVVLVEGLVSFAPETPVAVAYGTQPNSDGRREVGDTRILHGTRSNQTIQGGDRRVEVVRNGEVVASQVVPADGKPHRIALSVNVYQSSWIALRHFPQLHTNPVDVIVSNEPIRSSEESAEWCAQSVELLWASRSHVIAENEREEARAAYDRAIETYRARRIEAKRIRESLVIP